MRDEFPQAVKEVLAKRVAFRCSNPNCRKLTIGPRTDVTKDINIGVAAHITAASPEGPRYSPSMSPQERKSVDNGIWLCQNCAKLVDSDETRYTIELLRKWKALSEEATLLSVESNEDKKQDEDISVIDSPGSIITKNQIGDNILISPTVDLRPQLHFFESETQIQQDQVTGLYRISCHVS